jgi:hypothetical protein
VTMAWDRTSSPNRHALGCVKSACCQWQLAVSIVAEEMSKSTTMLLPSWHFFKKLQWLLVLLRGEHALHALGPWQLPRQYGTRIGPSSGPSGSTSSIV